MYINVNVNYVNVNVNVNVNYIVMYAYNITLVAQVHKLSIISFKLYDYEGFLNE